MENNMGSGIKLRGLQEVNGKMETINIILHDVQIMSQHDNIELYYLNQNENGKLEISSGISVCTMNNIMLDNELEISPQSTNKIHINRKPYNH